MKQFFNASKQIINNRSDGAVVLSFNINLGNYFGIVKRFISKSQQINRNPTLSITDLKILRLYIKHKNKTAVAKELGVNRRTIYRSIKRCQFVAGTKNIFELGNYLNSFLSI